MDPETLNWLGANQVALLREHGLLGFGNTVLVSVPVPSGLDGTRGC